MISSLFPGALAVSVLVSALENLAGGSRLSLGQCNETATVKADFPEEKD